MGYDHGGRRIIVAGYRGPCTCCLRVERIWLLGLVGFSDRQARLARLVDAGLVALPGGEGAPAAGVPAPGAGAAGQARQTPLSVGHSPPFRPACSCAASAVIISQTTVSNGSLVGLD